jgi:hypothetical protein
MDHKKNNLAISSCYESHFHGNDFALWQTMNRVAEKVGGRER